MYLLSYDLSGNGHAEIKEALKNKGYQEIFPNSPLPPAERAGAGPIDVTGNHIARMFAKLRKVGLALQQKGFPLLEPNTRRAHLAILPNTTLIHLEKTKADAIPDLYEALEQYNREHPSRKGELVSVLGFQGDEANLTFWSKNNP